MSEQAGMGLICALCLIGLAQGLLCKWTWGYGQSTKANGGTRMTQYAIIKSDTLQYKVIMTAYGVIAFLTLLGAVGAISVK